MQIFTTKILILFSRIIILCTFCPLVSADTHFNQLFMIEPVIDKHLADRIAEYHSENIELPIKKQESELKTIEKKVSSLEMKHKKDAIYWFTKGLLHSNLASIYLSNQKSSQTRIQLQLKNQAYEQAIRLDKTSDQLSASVYSTMKHGLPEALRIESTQKELSMGGNGYSDSYYWYLHWSNIDQLKNADRDKEAEAAYQQMQKELQESNMDTSVYKTLTKAIEKETLQQQKKEPAKTAEAPPAKVEDRKQESDEPLIENHIILIVLVAAAILSLLIVTLYELVLKKKR